jgi:hypothetical protein
MRVKLIAGTSLTMWVGVLICGRMLTWFRQPFTDQPDALPAIQLDHKVLHQNIIQKPGVIETR